MVEDPPTVKLVRGNLLSEGENFLEERENFLNIYLLALDIGLNLSSSKERLGPPKHPRQETDYGDQGTDKQPSTCLRARLFKSIKGCTSITEIIKSTNDCWHA